MNLRDHQLTVDHFGPKLLESPETFPISIMDAAAKQPLDVRFMEFHR